MLWATETYRNFKFYLILSTNFDAVEGASFTSIFSEAKKLEDNRDSIHYIPYSNDHVGLQNSSNIPTLRD